MEVFFITCLSSSCKELYENTPYKFKNDICPGIDVPDGTMVGLAEISFTQAEEHVTFSKGKRPEFAIFNFLEEITVSEDTEGTAATAEGVESTAAAEGADGTAAEDAAPKKGASGGKVYGRYTDVIVDLEKIDSPSSLCTYMNLEIMRVLPRIRYSKIPPFTYLADQNRIW